MRLLTRRGNVYASLKMRKGRECGFNLETIVLALRFDIRNVREGERGTGRVMEDLGIVFISHFAFGQEIDWGFLNWDEDVALYQRRKYKSNAVVLFYLAGVVIILYHTLKKKKKKRFSGCSIQGTWMMLLWRRQTNSRLFRLQILKDYKIKVLVLLKVLVLSGTFIYLFKCVGYDWILFTCMN